MKSIKQQFIVASQQKVVDLKHRQTILFNMSKYTAAVEKGKKQYSHLESAKERASQIKKHVVENIYHYIIQFEENFKRNGGTIIWAKDSTEAVNEIINILKQNSAKSVVKSKSMTTEEIGLNHALQQNGIEPIETDLGEYIVQLAKEPPYHIVTPAMHKSRQDVANLFNKEFGLSTDTTPQEITLFVRQKLRPKFRTADAAITGANFLLADIGAFSITENEGNAWMSTAFPKIHIAIAGIEKILPSINDLGLFLPLLALHGTGQKLTVYNSIFTPSPNHNIYLILLDNKRTTLFNKPQLKYALACIRCGACLNNCPIYKNIGGYTYNTVYTGPIGAVISPIYNGLKQYAHLSFACTLCQKCKDTCPVKIDLPKLLLINRQEYITKHACLTEQIAMRMYQKIMAKRYRVDFIPTKIKELAIRISNTKIWGNERELPQIQKSFASQWKNTIKKT